MREFVAAFCLGVIAIGTAPMDRSFTTVPRATRKSATPSRNESGAPDALLYFRAVKTPQQLQEEAQDREEKERNDTLLVAFTAILAGFTGALFLATVKLWKSTDKLVIGAEDTAKRQLRAYVSVEVENNSKVTVSQAYIRKAGASTAREIIFEVVLVYKNTGQTPAKDLKTADAVAEVFRLVLLASTAFTDEAASNRWLSSRLASHFIDNLDELRTVIPVDSTLDGMARAIALAGSY